MYYTTHLIAGATAGYLAGNEVTGFVAGIVSHALLDMVPHHDFQRIRYCLLEIASGTLLFLLFLIYEQPGAAVIAGALGGVLPDFELAFFYRKLIKNKHFPSHTIPHRQTGFVRGLMIQAVVALAGIYIIS